MARRIFVAGNWKLNKTPTEARALASALRGHVASIDGVDIAVAPVAIAIPAVVQALEGANVGVAAQNVYWEPRGAFTGELAAGMVADAGCSHVIVGHSERRQLFGETDATVARRVRAVLDAGLDPILCIGETLEEREAGTTIQVVERQLLGGLVNVSADEARRVTVAYEPVWAIGTGRTATPEQAQDCHAEIRARLAQRFDTEAAAAIRIQYGGSVKPANAAELLGQPDIDGALVGGASLDAESFAAIIQAGADAS